MKKSEISKLDEQWARVVKDRARWVCEHCGISGVRMEAAHVVGRRYRTTRWGMEIDGEYDLCGHCFCHNCHQQYDEHGPLEDSIVVRTVGLARKVKLQEINNTKSKADYQDYEQIKDILERQGDNAE